LLFPAQVEAATYWVRPTGKMPAGCTSSVSAPADDSGYKATIAAGIDCLASTDTLNIRAGTYTEDITTSQMLGRSGTSYSNPTTIQAYSTEIVTINGTINFSSPGIGNAIRYIIFKADPTLHNLIFDCGNTDNCLSFGGGGADAGSVDHIKLDGIEAKNAVAYGSIVTIGGNNGIGDNIWFTHAKVHHTTGISYAFYVQSSNNIVEYSELYDLGGYAIHNYNEDPTPLMANNIYRYNYIHDFGLAMSQASFGIILTRGSNLQAYGNIIANGMNGINVGRASSNNIVYNNTVYGSGFKVTCQNPARPGQNWYCYPAINVAGSGHIIKNNIVFNNFYNSIDTSFATGSSVSNNLTIDPKFVDAAANNFQLQSGSPAINAGTSNMPTGISIPFNGPAPDIGAVEY
jgi:hypothetical protein